MTFAQLYGESLNRELGSDDTTQLFTIARRKAAVNEAQREYARVTECYTREVSIPLVAGQMEYDLDAVLPADYQGLSNQGPEVTVTTQTAAGRDLPRRDISFLNREYPGWRGSSTGVPRFHYVKASSGVVAIGLVPAPNAVGTLLVPYIAQPADMVLDSDEPYQTGADVRVSLRPWHVALVHYAASLLERYRKDAEAVERQLERFGTYVTDYLQRWRRPPGDVIMFDRDYYAPRHRGGITVQGDPRV